VRRLLTPWLLAGVLATAQSVDRALQLAAAGRTNEAERMLLGLEKANPRDPEVQLRLGLILLRNGKLPQARRRLESAAKLAPEPVVWLALAQARLRMDDLAGALAAAGRARAGAPTQAVLLFDAEVIKYHLRKGQAQAALDLAWKALAASDLAVFHHLAGKAHDLNRNPAAAADELQQAVRLDPNQAEYYLDLAQLFLNHNTPEPAELVLEHAARRFPKHPEVLRLLGVAKYGLGKTEEALDAFLQAIDGAPQGEAAYASLETLLPAAGSRLGEVSSRLRAFCKTNPKSPLGPYLLSLVTPGEAEELLRQALRAAPDFWPAWFELHRLLKVQDRWEEAAAALRRTVELKPDHAPAHYALAEYYSRAGDRVRAGQERETHAKLLAEQRAAAEKRRAEAPRLAYTLSER
jgi:tetratricopeptide (TPR) repeat protein